MNERAPVRVWDAPTRIVHWLLATLIAFSWWSAEQGELGLHRYSGYALFGLLVFRLYWAVVGSDTARLFRYVRGPRATLEYARTLFARPPQAPGHNPLGVWSALALLALLATQIGLGAFAVDVDGLESGPLSHLVSFEDGRRYAEQHERVFNVLMAFIALHVIAVLYYLIVKRDNLIRAMATGRRMVSEDATLRFAPLWRAAPGMALGACAAWALSAGFWL